MKLQHLAVLGVAMLLGFALPAGAEIFLRLQGITGSATETNHFGWMDVQSAETASLVSSNLINKPPPSAGIGLPPADMREFCFDKRLDSASPLLALKCGQTNLISDGNLDFTDAAPHWTRYYRLNFTNIYVTRLTQAGSDGVPTEHVCLLPQIVSWNYTQYNSTNGLPTRYWFSRWNSEAKNGGQSMVNATFSMSGIRKTNGVQLTWAATAGRTYRIFGVPSLTQPFQSIKELTASFTGNTNYTFTPVLPAMFFVVEELPAGY